MLYVNILSGYYMLSEPPDKKAISLISTMIVSGDHQKCLEFFYHMSGADVGKLEEYIRNAEKQAFLWWKRLGYQGNDWKRGFLKIDVDMFQVLFVATGTAGARKDIALDDVRIAKCSVFCK